LGSNNRILSFKRCLTLSRQELLLVQFCHKTAL
jgi:hypothetical protein